MYRTPVTNAAGAPTSKKTSRRTPSPSPLKDIAQAFMRRPDRKRRSIDLMATYETEKEICAQVPTNRLLQIIMTILEGIPATLSQYSNMRKDIKKSLEEGADTALRASFELCKRVEEMDVQMSTLRAEAKSSIPGESAPTQLPGLEDILREKLGEMEESITGGFRALKQHLKDEIGVPTREIIQKMRYIDPHEADGIFTRLQKTETELKLSLEKESQSAQTLINGQVRNAVDVAKKIGEDADRIKQGIEDLNALKLAGPQQEAPKSYACVVASGLKPKHRPALHSIAVTSLDPQDTSDEVLTRVRVVVDAKGSGLKIDKVRKAKNQTVLIGCGTEAELKKVEDRIKNGAGGLAVTRMVNKNPLVVLRDVVLDKEDEEIVQALHLQNDNIFREMTPEEQNCIKIKFKKRTHDPKTAHVVLQVSPKLWQRMTEAGALHLDMQRVRVEDQSPLIQCTRCLAFGHGRKFCAESVDRCSHCGGPHLRADCTDQTAGKEPRCCNCAHSGQPKTDHNAFSSDCPTRQKWDYLARSTTAYQ